MLLLQKQILAQRTTTAGLDYQNCCRFIFCGSTDCFSCHSHSFYLLTKVSVGPVHSLPIMVQQLKRHRKTWSVAVKLLCRLRLRLRHCAEDSHWRNSVSVCLIQQSCFRNTQYCKSGSLAKRRTRSEQELVHHKPCVGLSLNVRKILCNVLQTGFILL